MSDLLSLARRIKRRIFKPAHTPPLLEMIWPDGAPEPAVAIPPEYRLRQWRPDDHDAYQALLAAAEMGVCPVSYWEARWLPDGFFVVEHELTGELAAACFASHQPAARHPSGGNFGWLATSPRHAGKGLGRVVSAAVTARLIRGGYRRIYLETHDHRLPALHIYLSMGWLPLLYLPEMEGRWKAVYDQLGRSFEPSNCPR